jgi:non-specific riboncleoside hydrolase
MSVQKIPVIIDTDPGIDDAAALAAALCAPELDVQLISAVQGNVSVDKTIGNVLKLLTFWNKKIPTARGAEQPLLRERIEASHIHGVSGLDGYDFPKADTLMLLNSPAAVAQHKVLVEMQALKITLLTLGPLTNIALLLRLFADAPKHIERIVMMAGSSGRGNTGVYAEFNVAADPEAAKIVFDSGIPITMAPLDVGIEAVIKSDALEKIRGMGQTGAMLYALFKNYRSGRRQCVQSAYRPY